MLSTETEKEDIVKEEKVVVRLAKTLAKLQTAFYEVFFTVFSEYNSSTKFSSKKRNLGLHVVQAVLHTMQLASLLLPYEAKNWEEYIWFEEVILLVRFDYLLMTQGIGAIFLVAGLVTVTFTLLVVAKLMHSVCNEKKVKESNYKLALSWPLEFLTSIFFIPFLSIFLAKITYVSLHETENFHYKGKYSGVFELKALDKVLPLWVAALLFLVVCNSMYNYEQFYTRAKYMLKARAHSRIEVLKVFSEFTLVVSYYYFLESSSEIHYLVCLVLGLGMVACYVTYLPFYNRVTNFTSSVPFFVVFWFSIVKLLGLAFDNGTLVFVLEIFVTPFMLGLLWVTLVRRESYIVGLFRHNRHYENKYLFEIAVRLNCLKIIENSKTLEPEKKARIKTRLESSFRKMRKFNRKSKLFLVWEALFNFLIMKKEDIARLMINQALFADFEFEGAFLRYKYLRYMNEFSKEYLEETEYVKFMRLYQKARRSDLKVCKAQIEFWDELSRKELKVEKLEEVGTELFYAIKKAKNLMEKLIADYPTNQLALGLYGTFLLEIYNDSLRGNELCSRAQQEKEARERNLRSSGEKLSFFEDSVGIIEVSGDPKEIGTIKTFSSRASDILQIPAINAVGLNISNFLPPPMNISSYHNSSMMQFIQEGSYVDVPVPYDSFLIDFEGYVVEVYLKAKYVALEEVPFFLIGIKKITNTRDCIIFDNDGMIVASTRGFAETMEYLESGNIVGLPVSEIIRDFGNLKDTHELGEVFEYCEDSFVNSVYMKFENYVVKSKSFRMLYATRSLHELELWAGTEKCKTIVARQQAKHKRRIKRTFTISTKLKGILKAPREKSSKKNISFEEEPEVFYLKLTDFPPGRRVEGKEKDAAPTKKPELGKEEELNEELENLENISNLKDLADLDLKELSRKSNEEEKEDNQEPGVQSVVSSQASSNSSFTSTGLARALIEGVKKSIGRFKVAFFLTILIVNAGVFGMMGYLSTISNRYLETIVVRDLVERRVLASYLGLDARNLQLAASDLISDPEIYKQRLSTKSKRFDEIVELIEEKFQDWKDPQLRSFYLDSGIETFEMQSGTMVKAQENLMNAMRKLVLEGELLANTDLAQVNKENEHFFYLLRNSYGESMKAMNYSINLMLSKEEETLNSILAIIILLGACVMALLVLCMAVIIMPTIFSIEKSNQSVWQLFYLLPLDLVTELRDRCEDRIENFHATENLKENNEIKLFKNLSERRKIKPKRKWPKVLLKLSVYYVISAGFFIAFYFFGYVEFKSVLSIMPKISNWASERVLGANTAFFWLQELNYLSTPHGYYEVVPEYSYFYSPAEEIEKANDHLKYSEFQLLLGGLSRLGKNSEHRSNLLDSACTGECLISQKGIHSAINVYISEINYAGTEILKNGTRNIEPLRNMKEELVGLLEKLLDLYDQEITEKIAFDVEFIVWFSVVYCLLAFILYFTLFLKVARDTFEQIKKIWKLGRLIPIGHRKKILQSLEASEKKSNK